MKYCLNIVFIFFFFATYGQGIHADWKQGLNSHLEKFKACKDTSSSGINSCNDFIGGALSKVYKINDFYARESGRHMLVSEIGEFLKGSSQWRLVGYGYEQEALTKAQEYANGGKAAVAIYLNEKGIGHVSFIVPGKLAPSGTWGFQVPNSASFFISDPGKSYIEKGLSYSFDKSLLKEVLLYVRN